MSLKIGPSGDFPGGLALGTSPSNSEGAASVSGQGARIPHACGQKPRGNTLANSIKALKNRPHQKKKSAKIKKKNREPFFPSFSLSPYSHPQHTQVQTGRGDVWAILKDNHSTEYKTQLRNSGFSVLNEKHQLGNNVPQSL